MSRPGSNTTIEVDCDVPGIGRCVIGAREVSIENTNEAVARKVLQTRVDYHERPSFRPRRLGFKPPAPLARGDCASPVQGHTCWVVNPEGVLWECLVEGPAKLHSQRIRGPDGRAMVPPIKRVDPSSHRRAYLVVPLHAGCHWFARGVAEFSVDCDYDGPALD